MAASSRGAIGWAIKEKEPAPSKPIPTGQSQVFLLGAPDVARDDLDTFISFRKFR